MSDSYDELERLARAATPGPWELEPQYQQVWAPAEGLFISTEGPPNDPEANYIACANPATILALISRLRRLEAVAQAARNVFDCTGGLNGLRSALEALDREEKDPHGP